MQRSYAYLGNDNFVGMIRERFARVLEENGFHLEVEASGPGAPHVYEYRRENAVVSLKVDTTAGEKWESEVQVETEVPEADLEPIIVGALTGLLADISRRLLESVADPDCRSKVARELARVVAAME